MSYNIASISDIHLGNRRTSAEYIINNLNTYLTNDVAMADIDLLFLAGDVFDTQLMLSSEDVPLIQMWIAKLLLLCKKHNVTLRVLEGTPSHDRAQSEQFKTVENMLRMTGDHNVDLVYVDKLCIEHIDRFNIDVLYVPDEWNVSNEETQEEVKNLLAAKGLSSVDYSVMHGTFEHQLPPHIKSPKHNNAYYESITKQLIFVGHIHIYSINNKVVSHGSFDRIGHGDESNKGYIKVNVFDDGHYVINFIENKNANIYKTVTSINETTEQLMERLSVIVRDLPINSNVRIQCYKTDETANIIPTVKARWISVIWSINYINVDEEDNITLVNDRPTYKPLIINQSNIKTLINDRLTLRGNTKDIIDLSNEILSEVL